jgi:hypothetical protein
VLGIVALATGAYAVGAITVVESLLIAPVEVLSAPPLVPLSAASGNAAIVPRGAQLSCSTTRGARASYVALSIVTFFSNFTMWRAACCC